MNQTPNAERIHIGIFGKRNAGKSSLINALAGQDVSVVSDTAGTTTDPVKRAMELLPLGPVVLIDTPGLDDEGALGELRVERTKRVLHSVDIALVVKESGMPLDAVESALIDDLKKREIPFILVENKNDLKQDEKYVSNIDCNKIAVSAKTNKNIHELKEMMARMLPEVLTDKPLVRDLIKPLDVVVLVTPIDEAAPKGRLILPQQMVLREILDCHGIAMVVQDTELPETLRTISKKPALVITDSQAFAQVSKIVPEDVLLTSFSILMARKKGNLHQVVEGAFALDTLKDGDKVLISEGCTHHRQCNDIGTVKLPSWIRKHTGKELEFCYTSGTDFPESLSEYALIVHCGGCMLNDKEIANRQKNAALCGVPMTNYGTAIAHMNGILNRSLKIFS